MKPMKKFNIHSFLCLSALALGLAMTSCADDIENPYKGDELQKGLLTIDFNINGAILSRGIGGDFNNESAITEVDLFFYDNEATEDTPAFYHYHRNTDTGSSVAIDFNELGDGYKDGTKTFKIFAVLNCGSKYDDKGKTMLIPSLSTLKADQVRAEYSGQKDSNHRAFRGEDAPQSFVMTNFTQREGNVDIKADVENGTKVNLKLRRVAAKISVALNVDQSVTDDSGTWIPDTENMRLYFSNGVRTARLDGDVSKLTLTDDSENPENSDYFSISTTGNKVDDNSDYIYARAIEFGENKLKGGEDADTEHPYFNSIPHYTYPTTWTESMTETHKPMLTIVIPWEKKENGNTIYEPTYYSIPVDVVDKDGNGELVSNMFYYLTAHIGMKGSTTPELPMPVDTECAILGWGTVADTEVGLHDIRFLILNQTDFTVNNETSYTVPFSSTHPCEIIDCKLWVYGVNNDYGYENAIEIDDDTNYGTTKAKGKLYNYSINNADNTFTFTHNMFDGLFNLAVSAVAGTRRQNLFYDAASSNDDRVYNEIRNDEIHGTYTHKKYVVTGTKKLYARFEVEITLRHSDKPDDTPYKETVILRFFPSIYLSSEKIDESGGINDHDGWILVNGYGTSDANTGGCKEVSGVQGNERDSRALLTFTVTTLSEDDKKEWGWVLDDPRTLYINNELADGKMTDVADNLTRWSNGNNGGPYDGTQRSGGSSGNRHQYGNGLNTIWEYYPREDSYPDWTIEWLNGTWDVREDYWSDAPNTPQYHRTLSYYYPTNESQEKSNIIAPKFTVVSYHAYAAGGDETKQTARRRCAAYQQWGYPAGRWRLPTQSEIKFVKQLQKTDVILDVFGGSTNWSAQGKVNSDGDLTTAGAGYTRCVYDNWYWEQVDAKGASYNKIPDPDGTHANWKKFHWGDRPKENPLLDKSSDAPTVENFIRKTTMNH